VKHQISANRGRGARRGISQIASHNFDAQSIEKIRAAIRANQGPDVIAPRQESFNQMTSQQARSPGN
jgi:hypothetical protein